MRWRGRGNSRRIRSSRRWDGSASSKIVRRLGRTKIRHLSVHPRQRKLVRRPNRPVPTTVETRQILPNPPLPICIAPSRHQRISTRWHRTRDPRRLHSSRRRWPKLGRRCLRRRGKIAARNKKPQRYLRGRRGSNLTRLHRRRTRFLSSRLSRPPPTSPRRDHRHHHHRRRHRVILATPALRPSTRAAPPCPRALRPSSRLGGPAPPTKKRSLQGWPARKRACAAGGPTGRQNGQRKRTAGRTLIKSWGRVRTSRGTGVRIGIASIDGSARVEIQRQRRRVRLARCRLAMDRRADTLAGWTPR